jgi:hypothetical protein
MTKLRFDMTRAGIAAAHQSGLQAALHALNHPTVGGFAFENEFESSADLILQTYGHTPGAGGPRYRGYDSWEQYRDAMHSSGKRVLFYNPDVTGVHPEAMRFVYGVGLWKKQADGVMNWHYYEPARDGGYGLSKHQGATTLNFQFPPTADHRGGPTIGWEAAREGIKDYQLLYTFDRLVRKASQSPDPALRAKAKRLGDEVNSFLSKLRFDTIDTKRNLSLGQWEGEQTLDDGTTVLTGTFKIPNGFAMDDYDRLRQLVCNSILALHTPR